MNITVDADYGLVFQLFGCPGSFSQGHTIELPGGCTLAYGGAIERRGVDVPATISLVLTFGAAVASSLVANWLWDRVCKHARRITIDRIEVELAEGPFKKVVREKIDFDQ